MNDSGNSSALMKMIAEVETVYKVAQTWMVFKFGSVILDTVHLGMLTILDYTIKLGVHYIVGSMLYLSIYLNFNGIASWRCGPANASFFPKNDYYQTLLWINRHILDRSKCFKTLSKTLIFIWRAMQGRHVAMGVMLKAGCQLSGSK